MTLSERRLHPLSVLFLLGRSLKAFVLPGAFLLLGSRSTGGQQGPFGYLPANWDGWVMLLVIPATALAVVRYLSFRIRYEGTELVIRSGVLFRNVRHIPYARIQNLNAERNVFHRLLGVTDVHIETGSGQGAEATISVIPVAALEEMRQRVFDTRASSGEAPGTGDATPHLLPNQDLLRLPLRELALLSVIQNRGLLPIGAVVGALWELGLLESLAERVFGEDVYAGGVIRDAVAAVAEGRMPELWQIAGALATVMVALALVQILSLVWVVARLHGFVLTRVNDGLRTDYGLLTRVATTVPMRRVQTLTIQQGPLQRLAGRASVRVETAGSSGAGSGMSGQAGESGGGGSEWLAPIIRTTDVRDLVRSVLPEVDPQALAWQAPHPRAFRRAVKPAIVSALVVAAGGAVFIGPWTLPALPLLLYWSVLSARQRVRHMAWADTADVVAFRSGWITRNLTIARTAKIQAVMLSESPFDRRTDMRRVRVDTAGAGAHDVDIPYLGRDVADDLYRRLASAAAGTEFRW